MKILRIFAATALVASLGVGAAADARHHRDYERYERSHHYRDHGRHGGRDRHHRRCHTEYRHHHRVRVCY